jgi:D-alanine-D-alanine ligase
MTVSHLRVAVIRGGNSSEREVSLKSGQAVIQALNLQRYRVTAYDTPTELGKIVRDAKKIDVALIMLHGRGGEDGSMQGLLDLLGIPYQSAGVLGCALAMNKHLAKDRYRLAGLPVAPDVVLTSDDPHPAQHALEELGLPLVVKPVREGSSFGISVVRKKKDLAKALAAAFALDRELLLERYLAGREITCGVLGNRRLQALPLVEITSDKKYPFFDYQAKYLPGASHEVCPAPLDEATTALLKELGKRAHQVLSLTGCSRSDFILTKDGPFILETNTIPGMTETSLLPLAAQAAGLDFPTLVDRLIELALGKKNL